MLIIHYSLLITIWLGFILLEYFFPREKNVFFKKFRIYDFAFVSINAFLFWLIAWDLDRRLESILPFTIPAFDISQWHIFLQGVLIFFLLDFTRWWTHRGLHYFSWGWKIHKTHHSITKLHFLRVLYYNPLENFVYMVTALPILLFFNFSWEIFAAFAVIDAIIGYSNHSNVSFRVPTWIAKIINTPQVHIWHHDESKEANITGYGKNFGINLSLWDSVFGTLYLGEKDPEKIGTDG